LHINFVFIDLFVFIWNYKAKIDLYASYIILICTLPILVHNIDVRHVRVHHIELFVSYWYIILNCPSRTGTSYWCAPRACTSYWIVRLVMVHHIDVRLVRVHLITLYTSHLQTISNASPHTDPLYWMICLVLVHHTALYAAYKYVILICMPRTGACTDVWSSCPNVLESCCCELYFTFVYYL